MKNRKSICARWLTTTVCPMPFCSKVRRGAANLLWRALWHSISIAPTAVAATRAVVAPPAAGMNRSTI